MVYKLLNIKEYILLIIDYCSLSKEEKLKKTSGEIKYTLCPVERGANK